MGNLGGVGKDFCQSKVQIFASNAHPPSPKGYGGQEFVFENG
jgi:hypothetical protein